MAQHFGKEHKLKSKTAIDTLFKKGNRIHSPCVTLIFFGEKLENELSSKVPKVLISVPKRNFKKAVTRNLLKRKIREAYRLQIGDCTLSGSTSCQWYFALVYKDTRIRDFNEIKTSIALLLRKLEAKNTEL